MNNVNLSGYISKIGEIRYINETETLSFTIPTKRYGKQDITDWHTIQVWGTIAKNCARYLDKGSYVIVSGALQYIRWTDKKGDKHERTIISANNVEFGPRTNLATRENSETTAGDDQPGIFDD